MSSEKYRVIGGPGRNVRQHVTPPAEVKLREEREAAGCCFVCGNKRTADDDRERAAFIDGARHMCVNCITDLYGDPPWLCCVGGQHGDPRNGECDEPMWLFGMCWSHAAEEYPGMSDAARQST